MNDKDFVQIGKVDELKEQIKINRYSIEQQEKRNKFIKRMNQLSYEVLSKLMDDTNNQEIKQDLCYIMGSVDSAILYGFIDKEERDICNF